MLLSQAVDMDRRRSFIEATRLDVVPVVTQCRCKIDEDARRLRIAFGEFAFDKSARLLKKRSSVGQISGRSCGASEPPEQADRRRMAGAQHTSCERKPTGPRIAGTGDVALQETHIALHLFEGHDIWMIACLVLPERTR